MPSPPTAPDPDTAPIELPDEPGGPQEPPGEEPMPIEIPDTPEEEPVPVP